MSPRTRGGYRPGRQRREVVQAVVGVLTVLMVTAVLIWVLAPDTGNSGPSTPNITLPPDMTSSTSIPGGAGSTVPTTTATTLPG